MNHVNKAFAVMGGITLASLLIVAFAALVIAVIQKPTLGLVVAAIVALCYATWQFAERLGKDA